MTKYTVRHQMKLYVVVALTGLLFGAELVASQICKSFVLLADAYHALYNLLSLLLLVIGYSTSKARTLKNTFGWARLEVLGILFNVLVLCSLYFALTLGAILHLSHASHAPTRPQYPLLILTFGLMGLFVNFICFLLIGGYTHHQECYLSIEGSEVRLGYVVGEQPQSICDIRQDSTSVSRNESERQESQGTDGGRPNCLNRFLFGLLRDASSCLLVVLSSLTVYFLQEPLGGALADYADPVASILGVILQIATTYPYLKETGLILLQTVPDNIDVEELKKQMKKEFPEIQNVHEFHVWKQSKSQVIATVHVIVSSPSVYAGLSSQLQSFFTSQGITSATVQPEFYNGNMPDLVSDCILPCTANCLEPKCCRPEHGEDGLRLRHGHTHATIGGHQHHKQHHGDEQTIEDSRERSFSSELESLMARYDFANLENVTETIV